MVSKAKPYKFYDKGIEYRFSTIKEARFKAFKIIADRWGTRRSDYIDIYKGSDEVGRVTVRHWFDRGHWAFKGQFENDEDVYWMKLGGELGEPVYKGFYKG